MAAKEDTLAPSGLLLRHRAGQYLASSDSRATTYGPGRAHNPVIIDYQISDAR